MMEAAEGLPPLAVPSISLAAAALLGLILAAGGARARRLLRIPVPPGLRLSVDFLAGTWVLGLMVLVSGLLGGMRPAMLFLLVGGLAAAGRWRRAGWRWPATIPPALAGLLLLPVALAPPFFYDALVYHLALPWQALMEGRIAAHPEDLFSAFPPLAQLAYAAPLAAGLDRVPALLHLASFVAAGAALAALAVWLGAPRWLAFLAGATLPLLPAGILVPGLPAAEGWTVAAVVTALAVTLVGRGGRGDAALAGFLAGCATAARLQGIPWAALVLAVAALASRAPLRRAAAAATGWVLGSSPWWLKNLILLREPFAPVAWRREGIETLWRDAGSQMHVAGNFVHGLQGTGAALGPHLRYLLPLGLASVLALVYGRSRRRLGILALVGAAGFAAWGATGILPRFLVPALAVLLALSAAAGATRTGRWAGSLALGSTLVLGAVFAVTHMRDLGILSGGIFREAPAPNPLIVNDPRPAFTAARALPEDARVLFVGEARAFPFPRRFVCPSEHDVSPVREPVERLGSPAAVVAWLRERGYTHLLVNRAELARLAPGYPVPPWRSETGRRRFQEILEGLGPPTIRKGEVGIFALSSPRDSP